MAKNSIDAYGASGKTNVLTFEPENLHLVTDKTHPLYDERIHLPISEATGADRTVEVRYVAPPGYVMVPKEPTKEMIDAGWLHFMGTKNPSSKGTYKAMLAAAEQEVPDGK